MKNHDRHEFFDCECHSPHHLMRVSIFQWVDEPTCVADVDLTFDVQAQPYLPWYKRVWVAVRYVLNGNGSDWYSSTLLNQNLPRLKAVIQDYETRVKDLK